MGFSKEMIADVWEKGRVIPQNHPTEYRKDECGAWIYYSHYGNRDSQYGWEIDHITPVEHGGSDNLNNLRPLQWKNNASRKGTSGTLVCTVTAKGTDNRPV